MGILIIMNILNYLNKFLIFCCLVLLNCKEDISNSNTILDKCYIDLSQEEYEPYTRRPYLDHIDKISYGEHENHPEYRVIGKRLFEGKKHFLFEEDKIYQIDDCEMINLWDANKVFNIYKKIFIGQSKISKIDFILDNPDKLKGRIKKILIERNGEIFWIYF